MTTTETASETPATTGDTSTTEQADQPIANFATWLADQPDNVQTAFETHTDGLKTALKAERDANKALQKQLRDLGKQAEAGSDLQGKLAALETQLGEQSQRAAFFEAAAGQGIRNPGLAYMAVKHAELIDGGDVDWKEAKKQFPELFAVAQPQTPAPRGNAGAGAGSESAPPRDFDMNTWIAGQAGKRRS